MHRWALLACVAVAALAGLGAARQTGDDADDDRGRTLYLQGCASCHGVDGGGSRAPDGSQRGPSLLRSGEAAAFYYLSTGRMPLANTGEQPTRKDPAYPPGDIEALVDFVASLGDGPALPDVDLADVDLAEGGVIYRSNCQACHSASAAGGALSYGRAAPPLAPADPSEIAAAVRAGPGQMPVFGPDELSGEQLDDLIAYTEYLGAPEDPGGLPIGRLGPIPEGFVAWLIGMGALLTFVWWIGSRSPIRPVRSDR